MSNIQETLDYIEKIHQRTAKLVQLVPKEKIDWTYDEERFTIADIIRHLAAAKRLMYAETIQLKSSKYKGCGKELASTYEEIIAFYYDSHKEAMQIFQKLDDNDLQKKCKSPAGIEISISKWLRAMIEHEIHHRGQLYIYLSMLGIKTPPLFGLTEKELASKGE